IGTVIGGGLLAGIIGGAALGAAGGTFVGPFIALEMEEEDARHYAREGDEGRTIVLVKAVERAEEARAIIRANGGRIGRPAARALRACPSRRGRCARVGPGAGAARLWVPALAPARDRHCPFAGASGLFALSPGASGLCGFLMHVGRSGGMVEGCTAPTWQSRD